MKKIISIILIGCALNTTAQKFYKDKTASLNAIKEKSYSYAQDQKNPNIFWYKRYDSYGESMVQLIFENNILRKAVLAHQNSTATLDRMMNLFKTISREETLDFELDKGKASNTEYYAGKALYQTSNDNRTRNYLFIIIPLD
jgi:hypothetical protein